MNRERETTYGFITRDGGEDLFCYIKDLEVGQKINKGDRVAFKELYDKEREQTKDINVYKIVWQAQGQVIDWVINRSFGQLKTTTIDIMSQIWVYGTDFAWVRNSFIRLNANVSCDVAWGHRTNNWRALNVAEQPSVPSSDTQLPDASPTNEPCVSQPKYSVDSVDASSTTRHFVKLRDP